MVVGEVWLCAGQSNMAMTVDGPTKWLHVGGITNAKDVVRDSANPLLRQFAVDWKTDTVPQQDCHGKMEHRWTGRHGELLSDRFTFFARELQQRLNVPVGILNASFGGSSVEGWTSREALVKYSDAEFVGKMNQFISDYENHEQLVADHVVALAAWEMKYNRADPQATPMTAIGPHRKLTLRTGQRSRCLPRLPSSAIPKERCYGCVRNRSAP